MIPVKNGENYLYDAVTSALNQEYSDFEIIIGVNPSTDRTLEIARGFQDNQRVKIIDFDNAVNMPANFNRAGLMSTGAYIKFLCHDDLLPPNSLKDLITAITLSERNVIAAGYESFIKSDRKTRDSDSFGTKKIVSGKTIIRRVIRYNNWIGGPSLPLIRRDIFFERQFDEKLECAFDLEYWIFLATKGNMALTNKVVLNSRVHPNQATNKCFDGGFLIDTKLIYKNLRKMNKIGILNRFLVNLKISISKI